MTRPILLLTALALLVPSLAHAGNFSYKPAGELEAPSQGRKDAKIYAPGMRFPIEKAPAYANSQVYGHGGYKGPGGGQCHSDNYSYPWWDNYCEPRRWNMPLCPGGKGHQGQDIRPSTCKDSAHWTVAAEDGTITSIGTYSVYLKTASGRTHRYLHLNHGNLAVRRGQKVQKGDRIGLVSDNMGDTPTTIHLHYDFKQYVQGVGTVFVPTYMALVDSYKRLLGQGGVGDRYDAEMKVRFVGLKDLWDAGSSKSVPDTFRDRQIKAHITLKNASRVVWRNVFIGFQFDAPHLTPVDYRIETDHPHYDQSTWMKNDADDAPENPPKDKMGQSGRLQMYAFSDGETKRIVVTFEVGPYSVEGAKRPRVRAWLSHIDNVYGEQTGFFKDPTNANEFGENIRDKAAVDVLSRDHWHFAGDTERDFEGWSNGNPSDSPQLKRNTEDDMLTQEITGEDARLIAPEWTQIDADRWDELILRVRAHDGPHQIAVYWAGNDQNFSEERVVRIESPGNSALVGHRIPVGQHPKWRGTVRKLRVDLLDDRAPAADALGWYGMADLFLQSSADQITNTERSEYLNLPASELVDKREDSSNDGSDTGIPGVDAGTSDDAGEDADSGLGSPPGDYDTGGGDDDDGEKGSGTGGRANAVQTSSCSTAGGGPLGAVGLGSILALCVAWRRRLW